MGTHRHTCDTHTRVCACVCAGAAWRGKKRRECAGCRVSIFLSCVCFVCVCMNVYVWSRTRVHNSRLCMCACRLLKTHTNTHTLQSTPAKASNTTHTQQPPVRNAHTLESGGRKWREKVQVALQQHNTHFKQIPAKASTQDTHHSRLCSLPFFLFLSSPSLRDTTPPPLLCVCVCACVFLCVCVCVS